MLTLEEIAKLEAFDGGGARVLSAYLDLDPAPQRSYRVVLGDLVDELSKGLDKPTHRDLLAEAAEAHGVRASAASSRRRPRTR